MISALVLVLSLVLLSACRDDSPIVSGEVRMPGASTHQLSARQVQYLNTWLIEHQAGWSGLVLATPPPTEALSVSVHRESRKTGTIAFYDQEGWKGALMYRAGDPKDNMQGTFATEQVSALRRKLQREQ